MTFARSIAATGLAATLAAGCQQPADLICTEELRHAIVVNVKDSVTGETLQGGSRVFVKDGAYADTIFESAQTSQYFFGPERLGTYSVTVQRPNYQTWTRNAVAVTEADECHISTTVISALLQH